MASGGKGFGTERARLGQDGCSAERARLTQGGSSAERARLAQGTNMQNFYLRRIRYFCIQNSKNPDPYIDFEFRGCTPPTCPAY